jgi:hypothetical protein
MRNRCRRRRRRVDRRVAMRSHLHDVIAHSSSHRHRSIPFTLNDELSPAIVP